MNFKVGEQVKLKSGGPVMTVDSLSYKMDASGFQDTDGKPDSYFCKWFAGATLKSGYFNEESLEKAK